MPLPVQCSGVKSLTGKDHEVASILSVFSDTKTYAKRTLKKIPSSNLEACMHFLILVFYISAWMLGLNMSIILRFFILFWELPSYEIVFRKEKNTYYRYSVFFYIHFIIQ